MKTKICRTNDKNLLTVVDIYAPTTDIVEKDPNVLIELYEQLDKVIDEIKNTSLMIIAGDMNSKIGKSKDEECCGKYSKGERNFLLRTVLSHIQHDMLQHGKINGLLKRMVIKHC